ncbi:MAG: glycosyltransferase [Fidelibacterota bacterium]|nr:MAG: glycosyltransferase [Candidatus Neomarinimicrobiota bacterium]
MRIALISPLPPYRGGISTFSYLMSSHLNVKHELYGVNFRRLYPQILFPGKTQLHQGRVDLPPFRTDQILDSVVPPTWDLAAKRIAAFEPDVCLIAYWMPFLIPAYWRLVRALRSACQTVVLCHNVEEHETVPAVRWLKRGFFQAADRLVVLSSVSSRQLDALSVDTPTEILFHPLTTVYGAEQSQTGAKAQLRIPPDVPVILFFGLVRPYKGLTQLLEAARLLQQQGISFHLRIAGEFYQGYDEALAYISRWDLGGLVTLENRFIPDGDVSTYFSAADVVALPYLSATQSGVVPIAYHFNRPVVVTDVGGLPEVVVPGETGFLIPPGDCTSLADVLAQNLKHGFIDMRDRVAQAKGQFSWENFITRLEQTLS